MGDMTWSGGFQMFPECKTVIQLKSVWQLKSQKVKNVGTKTKSFRVFFDAQNISCVGLLRISWKCSCFFFRVKSNTTINGVICVCCPLIPKKNNFQHMSHCWVCFWAPNSSPVSSWRPAPTVPGCSSRAVEVGDLPSQELVKLPKLDPGTHPGFAWTARFFDTHDAGSGRLWNLFLGGRGTVKS